MNWIFNQFNSDLQGPEGVPLAMLNILDRKGIRGDAAVNEYLYHSEINFDPFMLNDLLSAVEKIIETAEQGKMICVYGDYDADGICSASVLISVLRKISAECCYYIPSRFSDGYGLNFAAIDRIKKEYGPELLITVDCGSTSCEEVEYAKSLGIDVIVTDHHTPAADVPDCLFVNPKRSDNTYPFTGLSGCGVVFKLVQGIQRVLNERGDLRFTKSDQNELLDLVAISTIADVVPLVSENRTLVKYGLKKINSCRRPGLCALVDVLGLEPGKIDSEQVAYVISPNINALGRVASASLGVELLADSDKNYGELYSLAISMKNANTQRKSLQETTASICRDSLESCDCGELFTVILAPGAHEGVAGIVAGNLKEKLYRPVCIATPSSDGVLKGTGRSVPGVNLHEMLSSCSELFVRFGGHSGACGFTIKEENLDRFRDKMQVRMQELLSNDPELLTETLLIEKVLDKSEKNVRFAESLSLLEPFGEGNVQPVFALKSADVSAVRFLGSDKKHVRFTAVCSDAVPVNCILFSRADEFRTLLLNGDKLDIAGSISVNEFNGSRKLQLTVIDIHRSID